MNTTLRILQTVVLLAGLAWLDRCTPALAADGDDNPRLERLERRVNELAQRQEQLMNRISGQLERREQMMQPPAQNMRPPLAPPTEAAHAAMCPMASKCANEVHHLIGLLCFIGMICNILLAIWIYTDIRKRNEGSGIFVALALFAGIPTAIIYALTRIGDRKP